ncbi:MAG: helix-turn-helix domain-containing protein [Lachnoclostridium sp.]|nr:helix-turn-helix domain-containing protein [Lachnoclostridium sp.]
MNEKIPSGRVPHFHTGVIGVNSWDVKQMLPVEGCIILFCERGEMEITSNSIRCAMHSGDMAFILFDTVTVLIRMSDDFLAKFISVDFDIAQDLFFLTTSNSFWDYIYTSPVFTLDKDARDIAKHWFASIELLYAKCSEDTVEKVMRNEVENFMMIMSEFAESHFGTHATNHTKNRAWLIASTFLGLLNRYYISHHDVAFYAKKLNISSNYLNIISKRILGVSAKEQINIQLGLVIKMLLDTTELTVKEIAERLHYDDPSYLCRIFRKQNGLSPLQYRNKAQHSFNNMDVH